MSYASNAKDRREVSQFLVVPPMQLMPDLIRQRERFEDFLEGRFPGWSFDLCGLSPVSEDDEFYIIPIMNFITPDGDSYMCREIQPWVRSDILKVCREYLASDAASMTGEYRYGRCGQAQ